MTTTTRPFAPRLWLEALYTIPRVALARVDPITRWLILSRASVVVMTATSAVIGGLLALPDDVFDAPLLVLTAPRLVPAPPRSHPLTPAPPAPGWVRAHAASTLVNDFCASPRGADSADSPRVNYGPHPLTD